MDPENLSFLHEYRPATQASSQAPTLLLLHGTGGDERDLLALGQRLAPGAALLSPRGKVLEQGAPRFFRRLAPGVFDEADLRQRTQELRDFVRDAATVYGFDAQRVIAVGYSNGANIAASLLLSYPGVLQAAVLFRPMLPFTPEPLPNLAGTPIFIGAGTYDTLIPAEQTVQLAALLEEAGAAVSLNWQASDHALSLDDVNAAGAWLRKQQILASSPD
jgi:predicted esterase